MALNDYVALTSGIVCAAAGGEFFVRGTVGLADWARVSPGIVGLTVAAFATSSPELAVAVSAALGGDPQIALGAALGSNVANIALILAQALMISGLRSPAEALRRDFPVALAAPVMTGFLAYDGRLSGMDGVILMAMFLLWFLVTARDAGRQRDGARENGTTQENGATPRVLFALAFCLGGLLLLATAGHLTVVGARGIAASLGVDEFLIGATIVALGTSMPELATVVVASLRGHDDVSLGTILGSNIFNNLFIVPVAAMITPVRVDWNETAISLLFGILAVGFALPGRAGMIGRRRGLLLLALYAAYVYTVVRPAVA